MEGAQTKAVGADVENATVTTEARKRPMFKARFFGVILNTVMVRTETE